MATVYIAQGLKHDRRVALKVMRPESAPALGADRFQREIANAARLQHPHILGLFDSGVTEGAPVPTLDLPLLPQLGETDWTRKEAVNQRPEEGRSAQNRADFVVARLYKSLAECVAAT